MSRESPSANHTSFGECTHPHPLSHGYNHFLIRTCSIQVGRARRAEFEREGDKDYQFGTLMDSFRT